MIIEATEPDAKGEYALTFDRFFSRIHPDYREHAIEQFADLIAGRISEFHEVYPIHWYNDHEYEWLETQSSIPKYEINGDLRQLIGSARVITAQKQMEESLRIAKEEAERSNTAECYRRFLGTAGRCTRRRREERISQHH